MTDPDYVTPRPEWGNGGGDHDQLYRFGQPGALLSDRERARLEIRRPRLTDDDLDRGAA